MERDYMQTLTKREMLKLQIDKTKKTLMQKSITRNKQRCESMIFKKQSIQNYFIIIYICMHLVMKYQDM